LIRRRFRLCDLGSAAEHYGVLGPREGFLMRVHVGMEIV
jgi:hypothetical protein